MTARRDFLAALACAPALALPAAAAAAPADAAQALAALADRYFVLEKGEMVWSGDTAALRANPEVQERYLGV